MGEGEFSIIFHLNLSPCEACVSNLDVPKCFHSDTVSLVFFFSSLPLFLESVFPIFYPYQLGETGGS